MTQWAERADRPLAEGDSHAVARAGLVVLAFGLCLVALGFLVANLTVIGGFVLAGFGLATCAFALTGLVRAVPLWLGERRWRRMSDSELSAMGSMRAQRSRQLEATLARDDLDDHDRHVAEMQHRSNEADVAAIARESVRRALPHLEADGPPDG